MDSMLVFNIICTLFFITDGDCKRFLCFGHVLFPALVVSHEVTIRTTMVTDIVDCPLSKMTDGIADSRFAPSQWETALLCNDVSHWLGANIESALRWHHPIMTMINESSASKCQLGMSPWRPFLELLSRCPIFRPRLLDLPVSWRDLTSRSNADHKYNTAHPCPIFKWVAETWLHGRVPGW